MTQNDPKAGEFRVSGLSTRHPTGFDLQPAPAEREAIAERLGLSALKKLRFEGEIAADGARGWALQGRLGATVVQPCVVTLVPVTTRIDEDVERIYMPETQIAKDLEPGAEIEMPEDTSIEPLGRVISAYDVMIESLSLALPQYPRADGADLGQAVFAEDGVTPLKDEDTKPFSALAALRDELDKKS
ncbi:YceD family protein [Marivita sp. S2033]|uniref:YceD family protein n=1 Tax=Marivita sp. S2033 TaxID=3373187 RepID=UPI0039821032